MSYILDALRRADSERDRGAVPDVHARQVPMAAGQDEPAHASLPPWAWVGAALLVLLIGALAWLLIGRGPVREVVAAGPGHAPARNAPCNTRPNAKPHSGCSKMPRNPSRLRWNTRNPKRKRTTTRHKPTRWVSAKRVQKNRPEILANAVQLELEERNPGFERVNCCRNLKPKAHFSQPTPFVTS